MLQRNEEKDEDRREDELKNLVFANNPNLYNKIFGEESNYLDEDEIEHVVPESDADFNKLMQELKNVGAIE
jgi:hypothetical protein